MTEPNALGPKLEPPRGGLLRLQQAVRHQETRRFHTRNWVTAGLAASLVVLVVVIAGRNAMRQHRIDLAVRQALTAPPETHFDNGAYLTLPSHGRNARILLVASLSPAQPPLTTDKTPD